MKVTIESISTVTDVDVVFDRIVPEAELVRAYTMAVLSDLNFNVTEAAKRMGVGRTTLHRRLARYAKGQL